MNRMVSLSVNTANMADEKHIKSQLLKKVDTKYQRQLLKKVENVHNRIKKEPLWVLQSLVETF
jgi:hypothetical protein